MKLVRGLYKTFFVLGIWATLGAAVTTPPTSSAIEVESLFESDINTAIEIQYGSVSYPNYYFAEGEKATGTGNFIHSTLEWLPITRLGKLGFGVGYGLFFQSLSLQMADESGKRTERYATLFTVPIEAFVSYRLDYLRNQILVPFAKVGTNLTLVKQNSKSGLEKEGTQTYYGLDYGGGVEICLNKIDSQALRELDRLAGINNAYLVLEYLKSQFLSNPRQPDLTHAEYRVGLRMEL